MEYQDVDAALAGTGFICRGGFKPDEDDAVPGVGSQTDAVVIIIGNAGSQMWRHFSATKSEAQLRNEANPMDNWTVEVMKPLAERLGGRVHFPFERPFLKFQSWAMKADNVWQSPLGPLIHAEYGLWHAYRAALVFEPGFAVPERRSSENPCDSCAERMCLTACPVDAYQADRYDVPACVSHMAAPQGQNCLERHCLARRACPVGRDMIYEPAHSRFHMTRFLAVAAKRQVTELPKSGATASAGLEGRRSGEKDGD